MELGKTYKNIWKKINFFEKKKKIISGTAKEYGKVDKKKVMSMKGNIKMTKNVDMENIYGKMAIFLKVILKMI